MLLAVRIGYVASMAISFGIYQWIASKVGWIAFYGRASLTAQPKVRAKNDTTVLKYTEPASPMVGVSTTQRIPSHATVR